MEENSASCSPKKGIPQIHTKEVAEKSAAVAAIQKQASIFTSDKQISKSSTPLIINPPPSLTARDHLYPVHHTLRFR
jgi:hypothetical protein